MMVVAVSVLVALVVFLYYYCNKHEADAIRQGARAVHLQHELYKAEEQLNTYRDEITKLNLQLTKQKNPGWIQKVFLDKLKKEDQ